MRHPHHFYAPAALFLLFSLISPTRAALVIDQSNVDKDAGGGANMSVTGSQGQFFKPTLTGIDFITVQLGDFDTSLPGGTLIAGVYTGNQGQLAHIGDYSAVVTIPKNTGPVASMNPYTFTFPARIPLTPGTSYSFAILPQSGQFGMLFGNDNYPDGYGYAGANDIGDFIFAEGIITPEPSSLLLTSAAGTLLLRRRPASNS